MKSFTTLRNLWGTLTQNTSTVNLALGDQLMNDAHKYLLQKYFNNEFTSTDLTEEQVQSYPLPANYSKMKTVTITTGDLQWTLDEVLSRKDWDRLNVFPLYSDIPKNYFIYNGEVNIYPIPSSDDNIITYNYKIRVPDLSLADYTTGTVTMTTNNATITGSGTSWLTNYITSAGSVANLNLWLQPAIPKGDGNWYQISSITSATALTLDNVYPSTNTTQATVNYTIGQMPVLYEDFHDLIVYRALVRYFSTIVDNPQKAKSFQAMYDEGLQLMTSYLGSKTVAVNLRGQMNMLNPNIFQNSIGDAP